MTAARPLLLAAAAIVLAATLAARAAAPPPDELVTINPSVRFQTMRGWGVTHSFLRNLNFVSQATVDQVIDEAVNDLGLTSLRIGYGLLAEPFNDNGNPQRINWAGFHDANTIDRDVARGLGRFTQLVQANGETPSFLVAKDWEFSAPEWMTDAEFSEHATANLLYFRNQHGIDITFNAIDNEPDFFDPYTPARQQSIIKIMGPMFQANGLSAKIALNEGFDARSTWTYIEALQGDAGVWPHVGLLNWHLYGANDPFRSQIRDFGIARGIPTGMTEYTGAQIDHLMADLTLGGVSYWMRFVMVDFGAAAAGGLGNFFAANTDGTSFLRNHTYYQFRQFMKYVRPGAVRIEATSSHASVRAFAFDRAGTRVVVLVNSSAQAMPLTVQELLPGRYGVSQTVGQSYRELGVQDVGTSMTVTVPGGGVMTIYPVAANQRPTPIDWRATPGFLTLPAASIALTASAEDTERDALTYSWSVKSQPPGANVSLGSPTSPGANATGLSAAGTYEFTVTVRDSAGNAASRNVVVRAYQGNQAPVIAEGHRFYKQEWMFLPETTAIYGPLFISAFDLEGDPVTTSFSVVSQPSGANARFTGTTVSGMTVAGNYTFRFTASDSARTATRDFVRTVVSASDPPDPGAPVGTGRRRPPSVEPIGIARPRGTTSDRGAALPAAAPVQAPPPAVAQPAGLGPLLERIDELIDPDRKGRTWRRIEFIDSDADRTIDVIRIEMTNGDVWIVSGVG
jgi:O-glycosyl hydrolase